MFLDDVRDVGRDLAATAGLDDQLEVAVQEVLLENLTTLPHEQFIQIFFYPCECLNIWAIDLHNMYSIVAPLNQPHIRILHRESSIRAVVLNLEGNFEHRQFNQHLSIKMGR